MLLTCQQENDALLRKQQTILTKYNKLKTLTVQLETFKKSIVHMVTYSPASSQALPAEELSVVLDDGEHDADALNHRASHGSSSSRPDQLSRSEHSEQDLFRALRAPAPPIFTQMLNIDLWQVLKLGRCMDQPPRLTLSMYTTRVRADPSTDGF
ncbi:hypothetical protein RI367_007545 [Sorochytrium milnesiophthora]